MCTVHPIEVMTNADFAQHFEKTLLPSPKIYYKHVLWIYNEIVQILNSRDLVK